MAIHLLFLNLFFLSCSTTPITGKKAFLLQSEESENEMGKQAYRQILAKERPTTNQYLAKRVYNVALNIIRVSGRPDLEWEIQTLENSSPNAFALPGGKMAIYTGMIPYAQNEAGLAAIIGHEIGHVLARHGGQRISLAQTTGITLAIAGAILSGKTRDRRKQRAIYALMGAGTAVGVTLPFSRSNESEADEIGVVLMAKAGYDPREAVRFWRRFSKSGGEKPPQFLSTHPSSSQRAKKLSELIPMALGHYQKAKIKRGLGAQL